MAMSSKLEELDLTTEEVERFGKAFKDEKFRELFLAYADEISNPENKKKYEEEITLMEKERGVEVKFVHPQPGHVLKTSLNGVQKCYINICSNDLIPKPSCKAGKGNGNRKGQHWSLPYSLAPGREDLGKEGRKYIIYDVVFHPDTLYMASKNQRFKKMVDSTALEAIEKQFGVKLDEKNAKMLKLKYKGVPQAAVLRTPLPGKPQQTEDADDPLRFPYPYEMAKCEPPEVKTTRDQPGKAETKKHKTVADHIEEDRESKQTKPTTPHYTIVHRSHFDLQDYRYSRDATPSPVPKELVITIDLPLLKSAAQATLDVMDKKLSLESQNPDYSCQISLPYRVDENQGTAKFNKAKKQLVITLPVLPHISQVALAMRQDQKLVSDAPKNNEVSDDPKVNEPADEARSEAIGQAETVTFSSEKEAQSECLPSAETQICDKEKQQNRARSPEREPAKDKSEEEMREPGTTEQIPERIIGNNFAHFSSHFSKNLKNASETTKVSSQEDFSVLSNLHTNELVDLAGKKDGPTCPSFQCIQDDLSVSIVLHVPNIEKESLKEDVSSNQYNISFCSRNNNIIYCLIVQFPPHNKLNTKGTAVNISRNNVVVELSKSSESTGTWKQFYFGLSNDSLQERLFVTEENVDEFLEDVSHPVDMKKFAPGMQPLIEVLKVTDSQSHIRLKENETDQHGQKEERPNSTDASEIQSIIPELETVVIAVDVAERERIIEDNKASFFTTESKTEKVGSGLDCLQPEPGDGSLFVAEKCQRAEPEGDPASASDISAASVRYGKERFPQPREVADNYDLDEDDTPTEQQVGEGSRAWTSGIYTPALKEINMQDGSVHVITDHTTHCAFSFQNSVLYDLD
ncbi:protein kintoun [Rhinatrema bivittatum]|uniref:protein kintoun n=1 Tax=Rhinatrema bivittatum TaxID=194408 RepID=UPI00112E4D3A|nr:protein kintoun [Rhinatrema bivittatum]